MQITNAAVAAAALARVPQNTALLRELRLNSALLRVVKTFASGSAAHTHALAAMESLDASADGGGGGALGRASDTTSNDGGQPALPPATATEDAADESSNLATKVSSILSVDEKAVEVISRISSGQFGDVYSGRWNGSDVAVKFIKCGERGDQRRIIADFENEVMLMESLRHPNICMLMGAMLRYPKLCIITELCHRGSLYHILHAREKQLPWYRQPCMTVIWHTISTSFVRAPGTAGRASRWTPPGASSSSTSTSRASCTST